MHFTFLVVAIMSIMCPLLMYVWRLWIAPLCALVWTMFSQGDGMSYVDIWHGIGFD